MDGRNGMDGASRKRRADEELGANSSREKNMSQLEVALDSVVKVTSCLLPLA
jgi:hypothetical protein